MAVSAFMLTKAIQESATGIQSFGSVDAYPFASDDLGTCTNEMAYIIASEAADFYDHSVGTDDILTECALTDPGRFTELSEGVFASMKAGIKKFFDKIIAMVKGIIDKLKAFAYKLTGKVDKWVSVMEPKLRDASGKSGASDFKAEMYKYDEKFIMSGLVDGLGKLMNAWATDNPSGASNPDALAANLKGFKGTKADMVSSYGKGKDAEGNPLEAKDPASAEVEELVKRFQDQAEGSKKAKEDWLEKWPDQLAGFFGVSATSVDAVYSELIKKGHGGESEKTSEQVGNRWSTMLSTIKGSKKTLTDIQKVYDDHLKNLQKFRQTLEKSGSGLDIKDESKNAIPANAANAAREAYKEFYNHMMAYTQAFENAAGRVRQVNTDLLNGMTSDYMSALSKFAGFKGEKK